MNSAQIVNCTTMLIPPDGNRPPQNWTKGTTCYLPSSDAWAFGWEGVAAIATLLAVGLSWYFSWQARVAANAETGRANKRQTELKAMQDQVEQREKQREQREQQNAEFEQRRHAEQVAAWLTPAGAFYEESFIVVANHSQFPIWSVVLNHESFGSGETVIYPTIAAGSMETIDIGNWAHRNFDIRTNLLLSQTIQVTFVDINGRTWQRPVGDVPLLREIKKDNEESA